VHVAVQGVLKQWFSWCYNCGLGPVAQLVEQRIENPRVDGSIPSQATISIQCSTLCGLIEYAGLAQLVERYLAKV
jgi:hypothetical protein